MAGLLEIQSELVYTELQYAAKGRCSLTMQDAVLVHLFYGCGDLADERKCHPAGECRALLLKLAANAGKIRGTHLEAFMSRTPTAQRPSDCGLLQEIIHSHTLQQEMEHNDKSHVLSFVQLARALFSFWSEQAGYSFDLNHPGEGQCQASLVPFSGKYQIKSSAGHDE